MSISSSTPSTPSSTSKSFIMQNVSKIAAPKIDKPLMPSLRSPPDPLELRTLRRLSRFIRVTFSLFFNLLIKIFRENTEKAFYDFFKLNFWKMTYCVNTRLFVLNNCLLVQWESVRSDIHVGTPGSPSLTSSWVIPLSPELLVPYEVRLSVAMNRLRFQDAPKVIKLFF